MEKPLKDRTGTVIAGYDKWRRKVKVAWVYPDTLEESLTDTGLVKIEVRVTDPRDVESAVYALRAERAVPADPHPPGAAWMQWTGVELEVGGDTPRRVVTGTSPVALPETK